MENTNFYTLEFNEYPDFKICLDIIKLHTLFMRIKI